MIRHVISYQYYDNQQESWTSRQFIDTSALINIEIDGESLVDDDLFMQEARTASIILINDSRIDYFNDVLDNTDAFAMEKTLEDIPEGFDDLIRTETDVLKIKMRVSNTKQETLITGFVIKDSISRDKGANELSFEIIDPLYLYKELLSDSGLDVGRWSGGGNLTLNELTSLLKDPLNAKITGNTGVDTERFFRWETGLNDQELVDFTDFDGTFSFDSSVPNHIAFPTNSIIESFSYTPSDVVEDQNVSPFLGEDVSHPVNYRWRFNAIRSRVLGYITDNSFVPFSASMAVNYTHTVTEVKNIYGFHDIQGSPLIQEPYELIYDRVYTFNFSGGVWDSSNTFSGTAQVVFRRKTNFRNSISIIGEHEYWHYFYLNSLKYNDNPVEGDYSVYGAPLLAYSNETMLLTGGKYVFTNTHNDPNYLDNQSIIDTGSDEPNKFILKYNGLVTMGDPDFGNNKTIGGLDLLKLILFTTNTKLYVSPYGLIGFKSRGTSSESDLVEINNDDYVISCKENFRYYDDFDARPRMELLFDTNIQLINIYKSYYTQFFANKIRELELVVHYGFDRFQNLKVGKRLRYDEIEYTIFRVDYEDNNKKLLLWKNEVEEE